MTSGLARRRDALLAEGFKRSDVEVERHDDGRFLPPVHQDCGLAGEPGAGDDLAQDVTGVGDLGAVLGSGRGHDSTVADLLHHTTAQTRFLSYDVHVGVVRVSPP